MPNNPVLSFIGKKSYLLAMAVILVVLFARVFTGLGAPNIFKFIHFGVAIVSVVLISPFIKGHIPPKILVGLLTLILVLMSSALVNGAGVFNGILVFSILAEPFLLFLLIINTEMTRENIKLFQLFLMVTVLVNGGVAYYQYFSGGYTNPDLVQGLFFGQGAGAHIAGGITLAFALYILRTMDYISFTLRMIFAMAILPVVLLSDSKQVVAAFMAGFVPILLASLRSIRQFILYFSFAIAAFGLILVVGYTVYPVLIENYNFERLQDGVNAKMDVFPFLVSHYESPLNWIFGLGPGHTVGRIALLLPDYAKQLMPLGATISPITGEAIARKQANWLSNSITGSSMWAPDFFWAGLWGDLGLAGVGVYLYLWLLILKDNFLDTFSKVLIFSMWILGALFSWIEEPGYILFIVCLIGLSWQDNQNSKKGNIGIHECAMP